VDAVVGEMEKLRFCSSDHYSQFLESSDLHYKMNSKEEEEERNHEP
jgi:hypothetical protein